MTSGTEGIIQFKAKIESGWHLYGTRLPEGGPRPTSFNFDTLEGVELIGDPVPSQDPIEKVDMVFHLNLSWWADDVTFTQKFKITDSNGAYKIAGTISFQGCNDSSCMAPTKETFEFSKGTVAPVAETAVDSAKTATADFRLRVPPPAIPDGGLPLHSPKVLRPTYQEISPTRRSGIFHVGIHRRTPCSHDPLRLANDPHDRKFLPQKSSSRSKSIRDAAIYGVSIIVIYLALGLAITLIFGAGKLNELSTNAVFNLLFFALLVVFAISFFGAFDITLPSKWSNTMDGKVERTTGLISIFFMAFTLALVSFSCTGPIIGTLLVEAASLGDITGPAVGMGAFALALAIPFSLFAIFPSWLKEMPRSGGWLNSVKVVLGFLELALSLKFLSVADLAYGWGILDREVFVSLWIIIFVLLGLYLLGKSSFPTILLSNTCRFHGFSSHFSPLVSPFTLFPVYGVLRSKE